MRAVEAEQYNKKIWDGQTGRQTDTARYREVPPLKIISHLGFDHFGFRHLGFGHLEFGHLWPCSA